MVNQNTPDTGVALKTAKRLLGQTVPSRIRLLGLTFIFMVGVSLFTAALAYTTKLIVNDVFVADNAAAAWRVAAIVIGVSLGKSFFQYGNTILRTMLHRSVASFFQKQTFAKALFRDVGYFVGKHASDRMAQLRVFGMAAGHTVTLICSKFVTEALTLIALFGVMVMQDALMTLFSITILPIIFLLVSVLSRKVRKVAKEEADLSGQFFAIGAEAFLGIKTVKSYGLEKKSIEKFNDSVDALENRIFGISKITAATAPAMEFLGGLVLGSFVIYAAWQTISYGKTPGEFTAFITAYLMAYQPAQRLSNLWVDVQKSLVQVHHMYELIDARDSVVKSGSKTLEHVDNSLQFQNVSFSYGPNSPALHDVSVLINSGEKIAIVGKSGAGKSTFIDLVLRFYDPQNGKILLGGVPLIDVNEGILKSSIALISQDVFLFDGTIRENILDGHPNATDKDLERVLKAACLSDVIAKFELGLDTKVGANGANLSGGQKQRIAIARGLIKNAKVYIFDEATSALDVENEREIMTGLADVLAGATVLFVTHRPATFAYVDRILMLDKGQLADFDTYARLTKSKSKFSELFD